MSEGQTIFDLNYLKNLTSNKAEESLHLEFKGADAFKEVEGKSIEYRKNELSIDISAFANADGGVIIYGLSEKDKKADKLKWISDPKITKEWIEQVLEKRISKKLSSHEILPLTNPEGETIFIINIKPSSQAPHMAGDGCYYRRTSAGNRKLEEYEVREMYNRKAATNLKIESVLGLRGSAGAFNSGLRKATEIFWQPSVLIENIGSAIETSFKIEMSFHSRVRRTGTFISNHKDFSVRADDKGYIYYTYTNKSPLFQTEKVETPEVHIEMNQDNFSMFMKSDFTVTLYFSSGITKLGPHKISDIFTDQKGNLIPSDYFPSHYL